MRKLAPTDLQSVGERLPADYKSAGANEITNLLERIRNVPVPVEGSKGNEPISGHFKGPVV